MSTQRTVESWTPPAANEKWTGQNVPRKEDQRLVKGQGAFTDDAWMHRAGHVHFVRSPYAHAAIRGIDVSAAERLDGVYATLTGEEVRRLTDRYAAVAPEPGGRAKDYCLAVSKARFSGEPVAAVLAETRELARDAAALVEVDYEPLPVVLDAVQAASDPRCRSRPHRSRFERRLAWRLRLR
jgi:2-furoyl-CoA dehydrogenase large subunit